jgi:hypothetical protein
MQLRYFICVIGIVLLSYRLFSQTIHLVSVREFGLSGADITYASDRSGIENPAGLGTFSEPVIGLEYHDRYFLPELGSQLIYGTIPTLRGTFSPFLYHAGSKACQNFSSHLSYGLSLTKWMCAGMSMAYHTVTIEALKRKDRMVTGDLALLIRPRKKFSIAAILLNPFRSGSDCLIHEQTQRGAKFGLSFFEQEKYRLAASLYWDNFKCMEYALGSEYLLAHSFMVRFGVRFPDRLSYSFGAGIEIDSFFIDIGVEQHTVLGLSSALAICYKIK